MAESKPRKSLRKTKIEENSIEDQPVRVGRVSSARKFVRRLSPAPGMDDIAVPQEIEEATIPVDMIEQAIIKDDVYSDTASAVAVEEYNVEASYAHIAVDAQHIHGTGHKLFSFRVYII